MCVLTSVYHVVVVEVVDSIEDLTDRLRCILLRESPTLADAVKEFSTSC